MNSRYEWQKELPEHLYGGFLIKKGETATIKMLGLPGRTRNQPDNLRAIIFTRIDSDIDIRVIDNGNRLCALGDLNRTQFRKLYQTFPKKELLELRALEREYYP